MSQRTQSDPSGFETLEAFSHADAFNRWLYQKISVYVRGNMLEIGSGIGNISAFLLKDQTQVFTATFVPNIAVYCRINSVMIPILKEYMNLIFH